MARRRYGSGSITLARGPFLPIVTGLLDIVSGGMAWRARRLRAPLKGPRQLLVRRLRCEMRATQEAQATRC